MTDLTGRTAFVTGAAGFIGSHLCEMLVERGANVKAMARYTSRRDEGHLSELAPAVRSEVEVVFADIRDGDTCRRIVRGQETIFHLAASISVPWSFVAPRESVATNVEGSLNMLQAAVDTEASAYVQMSSSEVYGTAQYTPIDEAHPLHAQSPYAASKVGADKLAETFCMTYGLPVVVARPFNTYGPRQSLRAVIPTVVAQALAGGELRLGSLTPRRDFVYVRDTCEALVRLATEPRALRGEVVNIATGSDVSVQDVVDTVGRLLGRELRVVQEGERVRPEASEVHRLLGSSAKLQDLTGWAPGTPLEDGLRAVVEWLRDSESVAKSSAYAI